MADKQTRQKELARIQERDGCVRPSVIVAESKRVKAPLHDEFEWDNDKAGHEHRLSQARRLIRVTVMRDDTGVESRWVHVPVAKVEQPTAVIQEREGVYKPIRVVAKDPHDYRKCLHELMKQREAMDRTIRELQRAARVHNPKVKLIDQLVDELSIVKTTLHLMLKEAA